MSLNVLLCPTKNRKTKDIQNAIRLDIRNAAIFLFQKLWSWPSKCLFLFVFIFLLNNDSINPKMCADWIN